jgi:hypothetical protein
VLLSPLADGGEGHARGRGGGRRLGMARGRGHRPHRPPGRARWLRSSDGRRAVVELAEASGLSRLTPEERDPTGRLDLRHGQVLRAVIESGVEQVTIGIGGSATTDGGTGSSSAWRASDPARDGSCTSTSSTTSRTSTCGSPATSPIPCWFARSGRDLRPAEGRFAGAGRGARRAPRALCRQLGRPSGATSARRRSRVRPGRGFALLSIQDRFRSFALRPGVDLVMELTDFERSSGRRTS